MCLTGRFKLLLEALHVADDIVVDEQLLVVYEDCIAGDLVLRSLNIPGGAFRFEPMRRLGETTQSTSMTVWFEQRCALVFL